MKDIVYATSSQATPDDENAKPAKHIDVFGIGTKAIAAYTELESASLSDVLGRVKALVTSPLLVAIAFGVYAFIKCQEAAE